MFGYNGSFGSLFFFAFLASFISYTQQQKPLYIYGSCDNTATYSQNSTYSSNLRSLLSSLSSNNISFSNGFYSTSAGQSPDVVYGTFLCRGDLSPEACRDYIVDAAKFIVNVVCTKEQKKGWILADECMLRYSDQNFVYDSSLDNGHFLYNVHRVESNQDLFKSLLFSLLNQSAIDAAGSSRKFYARKASTQFESLYALVQCTPDLTREDCLRCLQRIINELPTDLIGGRHVAPSCNVRYELYPFYNQTAITSPPLNLLSPPPMISIPSPPAGKGGNSSARIDAIVVPIIVVFLLFIAAFSVVRAKKTKTIYETEPLAKGNNRRLASV